MSGGQPCTARQYTEHSHCPVCEEFRSDLAKSEAALAAAAMNDPAAEEKEPFAPQKFGICVMVSSDAIAASNVDELARRRRQARGDLAVKVFEAIPNDYVTMLSVCETMEPNNEVRAVEVRITADVTPLPEALETVYRLRQKNAALRSQLAPLYAELGRLSAENGKQNEWNETLVGQVKAFSAGSKNLHDALDEKDATIDRLTKLLVEVRPYVRHYRLCVLEQHDAENFSLCKCGLKALLTSIDAEIGGI